MMAFEQNVMRLLEWSAQQPVHGRPATPSQSNLRAVRQDNDAIARAIRHDFLEPLDIDDSGAMYAHEDRRIEQAFQRAEGHADHVRAGAGMELGAVIGRLDPVDFRDAYHLHAVSRTDGEPRQVI